MRCRVEQLFQIAVVMAAAFIATGARGDLFIPPVTRDVHDRICEYPTVDADERWLLDRAFDQHEQSRSDLDEAYSQQFAWVQRMTPRRFGAADEKITDDIVRRQVDLMHRHHHASTMIEAAYFDAVEEVIGSEAALRE